MEPPAPAGGGSTHPEQKHGQKYVEKGQGPEKERFLRIEHIVRQPGQAFARQKSSKEGHVPEHFGEQNADRHHARQQAALEPKRGHSSQQSEIREPQKIAGTILDGIDRNSDGCEERVGKLNPEWDHDR